MKIKDILKTTRTLSFEFFPPRTYEGMPSVFRAIERLSKFNPDFISVTYGAGGSTRAFTEELVVGARQKNEGEAMAHVTCVGQSKQQIHEVLTRLQDAGIENVIALRGDPPRGQDTFVPADDGFEHANELVEHIKRNFHFGLAAACYPESHQESPNPRIDLEFVKQKVDLGADYLITQLFFDNDDFFNFLDRARQAGIDVPIIPGLIPVVSTAQIRRITSLCGSRIPEELDRMLEECVDDDRAAREVGIEHTLKQAKELWDAGVDGIHFYVLNRSYSMSKILGEMGIPGRSGSEPAKT